MRGFGSCVDVNQKWMAAVLQPHSEQLLKYSSRRASGHRADPSSSLGEDITKHMYGLLSSGQ